MKISNYISGKIEGEYKLYWENGQLDQVCNYINGVEQQQKNYEFSVPNSRIFHRFVDI